MPQVCSIWIHAAHAAIDDGLVTTQSPREIPRDYGLSKSVVDRHRGNRVDATLAQEVVDLQIELQAARQADRQHSEQIRGNAKAVMRVF